MKKNGFRSLWFMAGLSTLAIIASCTGNNIIKDESLGKYFKENNVEGCFGLMNNGTGKITVYNLTRFRDSSYLPASTFKIINSLIGLQTGKIVNDSMVIKWDGVQRPIAAWNKDLTMYEAFRVSSVPYYQEVARRIGKETMEYWMDTLKYISKSDYDTAKFKIKTRVDSFWLDNSLKVSPIVQLGIVKKLYFDQLPFFKDNMEKVRQAMLFEHDTINHYDLSYKTGWGRKEDGKHLAWIVGWIEENKHPYFFVVNLETADANADIPGIRMKILKGILEQMGFMKGKM
jgi:beta-lactamase class D